MSSINYAIGVDIGTTSTKAVLFTEKGVVVHQHGVEYPLYMPTTGVAEQEPEEILAAVIASVKAVISASQALPNFTPANLLCVSFSAAMHSIIAVDSDCNPLSRSITWADNRSAKWATWLKQDPASHGIYRRTGTPIHAMSPLIKLIWLRHEQPDLFKRTAKFISIKEFVFYRLCGQYLVDYAIASATGLMNLETLTWDQESIEIAGIKKQQLSQIVPTTHIVNGIDAKYAEAMGIAQNTPFAIGASDGVLSNLGVDAIAPGVVAVTVGTSGAVRAVVDRPWTDLEERLFCYALTDKHWVIGGAVNNGGIVFRWMRDQLCSVETAAIEELGQNPYDMMTDLAQTVAPGSDGLIFYPYMVGERAPIWDANASGSFIGLTFRHTKAHLIRAMLEGIGFNLYMVLQALEDAIGQPKSVRATGGMVRSPLWRQLMADIFQCEIAVPDSYESSCLGAVVLGLYALKYIPSLEIVSDIIGQTSQTQPIAKNVEIYQNIFPIYKRLLQLLQTEYANLANL